MSRCGAIGSENPCPMLLESDIERIFATETYTGTRLNSCSIIDQREMKVLVGRCDCSSRLREIPGHWRVNFTRIRTDFGHTRRFTSRICNLSDGDTGRV